MNLWRRHLDTARRIDLASSLLRIEKTKAKERQIEGGRKGGKKAGKGRAIGLPSNGGKPKRQPTAATDTAKSLGVSTKAVERVERVKKKISALTTKDYRLLVFPVPPQTGQISSTIWPVKGKYLIALPKPSQE